MLPCHSSTPVSNPSRPKLLHYDPNNITTEKEVDVRNRLFNIDGLGVAWYTDARNDFIPSCNGLRPALYKTVQPPLNDLNFRQICANTQSKICFAHIRAATSTATTPVNNHPFVFGRHAFMHNGFISDFLSIRRQMCELLDQDAYGNVLGSTDSEHLAALYITYLTSGRGRAAWEEQYSTSEMADALHRAVSTVISLQQQVLGVESAQPNCLNLAATDGSQLIAYRFRNHAVEQPPSLYYSTTAGVTLNSKYPDRADGGSNPGASKEAKEHGSHVIVASEPSTYKEEDWELIRKNCCLTVESDGSVNVFKVPYEESWNARSE